MIRTQLDFRLKMWLGKRAVVVRLAHDVLHLHAPAHLELLPSVLLCVLLVVALLSVRAAPDVVHVVLQSDIQILNSSCV